MAAPEPQKLLHDKTHEAITLCLIEFAHLYAHAARRGRRYPYPTGGRTCLKAFAISSCAATWSILP